MAVLYCSFCGKSNTEVSKLIAGPTVFICSNCVEICTDIIKNDLRSYWKCEHPNCMCINEYSIDNLIGTLIHDVNPIDGYEK